MLELLTMVQRPFKADTEDERRPIRVVARIFKPSAHEPAPTGSSAESKGPNSPNAKEAEVIYCLSICLLNRIMFMNESFLSHCLSCLYEVLRCTEKNKVKILQEENRTGYRRPGQNEYSYDACFDG